MIYAPVGRDFRVKLTKISGPEATAWWYNPRDGSATLIGKFPTTGTRLFTPPTPGEELDWILVLDDSEKFFKKPGEHN
jgi:hypothetical protein